MNFETYLMAVLDCNLPEVKDEIKEIIVKKALEYKGDKERQQGDLISREALRKAFHERIYYFNKSSWDEANAIIDNAPTVEPKQGEWIATQVIGISDITLTCSNCKDEFIGENDIDTWKSVYHYCPSCGAYMGEDMRKGGAE